MGECLIIAPIREKFHTYVRIGIRTCIWEVPGYAYNSSYYRKISYRYESLRERDFICTYVCKYGRVSQGILNIAPIGERYLCRMRESLLKRDFIHAYTYVGVEGHTQ